MTMTVPIKNIFDLQSEILRLEKLKQEQEMVLKQRVATPAAIISSVRSIFPKAPEGEGIGSFFSPDLLSLASRFILPLTLNKTLFKRSNMIVKTLVGLLSQKASTYISGDSVTSIWDNVKGIFNKKPKRAKPPQSVPADVPVPNRPL
ncbi:hypothetical protein LLH06_19715 [Mucilaginibacter daejeonensis]|uniref:hypothetical protein n=1 Tax=Mucilaginibacter daejeonensis TaxID=398049 RepID=UPI001D17D2FE|nr:hypothetical protein [Mucilaginibacter daejeonensis]UEG53170.1 hypothetical protein LLH06_19715 [Mucilaginibacter daejeonensis]